MQRSRPASQRPNDSGASRCTQRSASATTCSPRAPQDDGFAENLHGRAACPVRDPDSSRPHTMRFAHNSWRPPGIIEHCSIIAMYSQHLRARGNRNAASVKIHQRQVIDVALALLDEQGLSELQMRAVASRLNVQASALYWHVRNKGELLSLMAGALLRCGAGCGAAGLSLARLAAELRQRPSAGRCSDIAIPHSCAPSPEPLDEDTEAATDELTKPLIAGGLEPAPGAVLPVLGHLTGAGLVHLRAKRSAARLPRPHDRLR